LAVCHDLSQTACLAMGALGAGMIPGYGTKFTPGKTCTEVACKPGCVSDADCNDGKQCTEDDCDPATGWCEHSLIFLKPCDDGDVCTTDDYCDDGICFGGPSMDCDDKEVCTDDSCANPLGCVYGFNTKACDDKDACTTVDKCDTGSCVGSKPLDCDDKNPCTSDSCDAKTGCKHGVSDEIACDDGDPCTEDDMCVDGKCNGAEIPGCCEFDEECFDLNFCTKAECLEHVCTYTPLQDPGCCAEDGDCDDQLDCTVDFCEDYNCAHVVNLLMPNCCVFDGDCDDFEQCTYDHCDQANHECLHDSYEGPCDDDDKCTNEDECIFGACVGIPVVCDDKNECTVDSCNPKTGCVFSYAPFEGCCTTDEDCNDSVACTVDLCDQDQGHCVNLPVDVDCEDGDPCTTTWCDPWVGCQKEVKECAGACCTSAGCFAATNKQCAALPDMGIGFGSDKIVTWFHPGKIMSNSFFASFVV